MPSEASADIEALLAEAIELHRQGQLTQAEQKYTEIQEITSGHPDSLHLLGVIAHQMGNSTLAIQRVNESLAMNPDQPIALTNLGNMLAEAGRINEAIESYRRAIKLDSAYAQAHHNLGNVLGECDRVEESIKSYRRSLELRPDDIDSRLAIGVLLEKTGRFDDAALEYQQSAADDPDSIVARSRLGSVLRKQNRLSDAKVVYDEWLRIAPDDPVAHHLRLACDPDQSPDRASKSYVKATFDGHAEKFEDCLAKLNYQVPNLIGEMVRKCLPNSPQGDLCVADLGCGTGLCAPHLRDHAGRLVGVDLSPIMLDIAREKQLYDELIEIDLIEHLTLCPNQYDLLVAGDTLIYIGDLQPTLAAACSALREEGKLIFSLENPSGESLDSGYRLDRFGRYSHSEATVRHWLDEAGFEVDEYVKTKIRDEGGEDVIGSLVIASRR